MNSSYTHRPLHATSSAPQNSGPGGAGPSNSRITDLLDFVRQEFDLVASDVHTIKAQNNEFETHTHQHIKEMQALRHNFMDLEREHVKLKEQYEEEIIRLRRELEAGSQHSGPQNSHPVPSQHSMPQPSQPQLAQQPHLSPAEARTGSGAPAPPQVGHGPSNLFGGIMANSGSSSQGQSAQQPTRDSHHPDPHTQPGATARDHYSNGWDRERRERDHMDPAHPAKRLREEGPAGREMNSREAPQYVGTPPPHASTSYNSLKTSGPGSVNLPTSTGAYSKQPPNPLPGPPAQSTSVPPTPSSEINQEMLPKELKKEGSDWITMYNPKVKKSLDVELVHTLMHDSVVCCVRFSPNGKTLATGCNRNTNLYDTKTGAKQCSLAEDTGGQKEDNYIRAACFSPDGKSIATGSEDRTIRIWDIASRKVRHAFHGHRSEIYSLAFSPDGRFLMSGSGDRTARIWDMDTGAERFNLAIEDTVVEGSSIDAGVTSVAVSPDGKLLAAGSLDTIVRLWDASTGKLLDRLRGHRDSVYSVAFSPDGAWLVSGSLDKTLKIWDLQPVKTALSNGTYAAGITASSSAADGNADVKTEDPSAKDVDKEQSAKIISTLSGHKDYVLSVAVSPDGNWIVSGSKDRGVSFWDPKAIAAAVVLQGHKNSVISIAVSEALSEGGGLLATGSGDWSCRIWKYSPIKG